MALKGNVGNPNPQNQNPPPPASTSAAAAATASSIIPDELLVGILTRLPVTSILRFKTVSDEWRTLTSHQTFLSAYHSRAPYSLLIHAHCKSSFDPFADDDQPDPDGGDDNQPNPDGGGDNQPNPDGGGDNQPNPDGGGDNQPNPDGGGDNQPNPDGGDEDFEPSGHSIFSFRPRPNLLIPSSVEVIYDFPGSGRGLPFDPDLEIIGSTPNGICCVSQKPFCENLTLWNPATHFSRSICAPKLKADPGVHSGASIGLAYDPDQDDIKIVRILSHCNFMDPPDEVEFYSLKSGAWTIMKPNTIVAPFITRSFRCDAMFKGVPYWTCFVYEDRISADVNVLMSFDPNKSVLAMEHFDMVLKKKDSLVRMGEIQGRLGAVSWEVLGRRASTYQVIEVWLRYETDGWKQLYRVDPFPMVGRVLGTYGGKGIVLVNDYGNGDLYFFRLDEENVVYEDSLDTHKAFLPGSHQVSSYKESFAQIPEPGGSAR